MIRPSLVALLGLLAMPAACAEVDAPTSEPEIGTEVQGLSGAARRPRSEAIRDSAATMGLTNGALLAGIAQVETGLSHCWSEATWACQGPTSNSCGGPVIAGSADGPCSAQQGGLGMFQFDGGTYAQTIARDGAEVLELDGNIRHAVEFVTARVSEEVAGVDTTQQALDWLNGITVEAGNARFEEWIEIVSCRYNGCCGCSTQEGKYRTATLDALGEFEPGFWGQIAPPPVCEAIPSGGAVIDEDDACADAGGDPQYWRTELAGHGGRLMWTHTTDSTNTENFARWNLDFEAAGTYLLEVYTDGGEFAQSRQAAYRVRHFGVEEVVTIDQTSAAGWQRLGALEFDAGGDQWVRFDDNTGEPLAGSTRIAFDALRVTPPADPDDPDQPGNPNLPGDHGDPAEDDLAGGCAAGGGSAGGGIALLMMALLVVSRRRRRA